LPAEYADSRRKEKEFPSPFLRHSAWSAGKGLFSRAGKIQMAGECLAEARQHGCSLATLDQPPAKSFADETGLVGLLH
jgi:hypothetical protein